MLSATFLLRARQLAPAGRPASRAAARRVAARANPQTHLGCRMNQRENLLRAVRFERPETIPMIFHINPACWQHYPHDALQELMAEHTLLFPDFAPLAAGFVPPFRRFSGGISRTGPVGLRVAHLRGRHHRHRHRAPAGRLGRVRDVRRARPGRARTGWVRSTGRRSRGTSRTTRRRASCCKPACATGTPSCSCATSAATRR